MLTIEGLKNYGADTQEGITRCFGNEEFYLKLVTTVPNEPSFEKLSEALAQKDLAAAFEYAHALKGVLSNLSLTPICNPVNEITELLRAKTDMDYSDKLNEILKQKQLLTELCES